MVEAADLRNRDDASGSEWSNRPRRRCVLLEREVGSRSRVVTDGRTTRGAEVGAQDDDVVEALASH